MTPTSRPRSTFLPRRYPGHGSMWFFVIGDLCIFACYFVGYVWDRARALPAFLEGQRMLSPGVGVLNTAILVTSSLFVALSAQATRAGDIKMASRFLVLGGACGGGFMVTKACEWHAELSAGFPSQTYPFFVHYFMLTGLHFFHVALGMLILVLGWRELHTPRAPRADFIEATATYWHMVDAIWMSIFAALYLVR